jgi:tetratricopeptide (TPR) repeat protein
MSDIDEKEIIKRFEAISEFKAAPEIAARDIARVRQKLSEQEVGQRTRQQSIWRTIMKSRITKLAAAAVMILVAVFSITVLDKSAAPAWAIEQTVEALENIQTLVITGTDYWGPESIPFKFWFRFSDENKGSFDMRYESEKQIIVVRGTRAWAYWSEENVVKTYENVKDSEGMMRDLRIWYKIADLNPWITGKMLATLKSFADEWHQTYGKDERTGRECVFVTCSYKPLSTCFSFACDLENKLLLEGKYWRNSNRTGPPVCHAISLAYNEQISDETFDFQVPQGAKVIDRKAQKAQQEADALFHRGEMLFEKGQTAEAIGIYRQVHEKYPDLNVAESALMMIGICYGRLGQREQAIDAFQKSIREYGNLKGWTEPTYFYLGRAYMDTGQKDKALEAFKNCLIMGGGVRDPDKFPLKHAREYIEKLKTQE